MFIAALLVLLFSAWYVPLRLRLWLGRARTSPLWTLPGLVVAAGFPAVLMTGWYAADSAAAGYVYNALGVLFIFQSYLFVMVLAVEAFFFVLKKAKGAEAGKGGAAAPRPSPLTFFLIVGLTVYSVVFGVNSAARLEVTVREIPVEGLAAPVSIVHAPDLHLGHQRGAAWLASTLKTIEGLEADLVIYNGDLVDSDAALKPEVFDLFRTVSVPQYYTTGNHEYYVDTEKALALARGAGLIVLRSEMVETRGLQLIGLEYMNADRESSDPHSVNRLTVEEELPKIARDPARPVVLVHHSPVGLKYVVEAGDIDLMLSGHTHGGQVFPGTILILFRFHTARGVFREGPTTLMVSQGAGTFGPYMRLGSKNEIQLVKLVPAGGGG